MVTTSITDGIAMTTYLDTLFGIMLSIIKLGMEFEVESRLLQSRGYLRIGNKIRKCS